jgi:hypothetical protein
MAGESLENSVDKESRIQLAISDYKKGNLTSIKEAARVHGVAYGTVRDRLKGLLVKCHTIPRTRKLCVDQENALVKYILNLNSRGFPPKPRYVREMASGLLAQDGEGKVGKNWDSSFAKRRDELTSTFTRRYDYRRALSEDPDSLSGLTLPLCRRVQSECGPPKQACQGENSCPSNRLPTPINEVLDKIVNYAAQIYRLAVLAQKSHRATEEVRARQNLRSATIIKVSKSLTGDEVRNLRDQAATPNLRNNDSEVPNKPSFSNDDNVTVAFTTLLSTILVAVLNVFNSQ